MCKSSGLVVIFAVSVAVGAAVNLAISSVVPSDIGVHATYVVLSLGHLAFLVCLLIGLLLSAVVTVRAVFGSR